MSSSAPDESAFDIDRLRVLLVDSAGVGLAILEPESLTLRYRNSRFRDWFAENTQLAEILSEEHLQAVRAAIGEHRSWQAEVEVRPKRRVISLLLELNALDDRYEGALVLQCQNVSKIKELEYMIASYARMIERQNRDVKREKERVERLLLNIMPKTIYEEWKEMGVTAPKRYDEASVLMLDFIGFTTMSISQDPQKVIAELNDIFTSFDRIVEQFDCERLKTIGDAYMAVSGLPDPNADHARNIARTALRFVRYLERRNESSETPWRCRIGISSGPVIGSVVGVQKYVYDVFGPAVNLAARLEPLCGPMEILFSEDMEPLLRTEFAYSERGRHDIRGFGPRTIYTLESFSTPA